MLPIAERMGSEVFSLPGDDLLYPDVRWQVLQHAPQHDLPPIQRDLPYDATEV